MSNKVLYQFTLDKEVEVVKESTRTNKKTGEETTTKKTVKEIVPIEIQILRPTRKQLEEAELEYSIEMSKCIKRGILTKAMLAKKYSDTGGLFSEEDSKQYGDLYKQMLDLQNEYIRLDTVSKKNEKQSARFEKVKEEVSSIRQKIVEFESTFQSLFDHTADIKAQNRVLLWYATHLTYIYNEDSDKFLPYFEGEEFQNKIDFYYQKEEEEDQFYFALVKKVSTILALWFFNSASTPQEFETMIDKMEKGEV